MYIVPVNVLIHRKAASFEHFVWMVSTLKWLHNSSELIHFMIQHLPMNTSSILQEAQSVSNYVLDWTICIGTLELQAFLNGNMVEFTIDLINEPAKQSPSIKLVRFIFTANDSDLDIRISPGIASSFDFFLCLTQHSWESVSDEVQVISSPAKILYFPGSLMKSPNSFAPRTPGT